MKQAHQTFIIEMIKHGDKTLAYQKAYPKCTDSESARKSAERLLRHHPDIVAEVEEATAHIRQRAYTEAYLLHTEQQKVKLLSMMDKREILARIARCEVKVCRYVKDTNGYRMLFEDPHPRDIIRAVEVDTRMEDICNRARNLTDPKLSQFNIYIDGRPCDDPTAPINPDLPPGIFMHPRTRKKLIEEQGNISPARLSHSDGEQNIHENPGINAEPPYRTDRQNTLSPSGGGSCAAAGGGTLAQCPTPTEEQGIKTEHSCLEDTHDTSPLQGVPIAIGIGVQLAQEQNSILSPAACPDYFGRGGGEVRAGGGTLAREKILIKEHGINPEHLSRQGGENIQLCPPLGGARGALALENSPLYPQYLALYQQRRLQAEDLLAASFYLQDKQATASAPPPHILTDEEVCQLHAEADKKQERKPNKQPYNTFGKMYFPPERS